MPTSSDLLMDAAELSGLADVLSTEAERYSKAVFTAVANEEEAPELNLPFKATLIGLLRQVADINPELVEEVCKDILACLARKAND